MNSVADALSNWFWNPDVWLPPNVTLYVKSNDTVRYPEKYDLQYASLFIAAFVVLRIAIEQIIWAPFGRYMGIRATPYKKVKHNAVLEEVFSQRRHVSRQEVNDLAKKLDWKERNVQRWLLLRRRQNSLSCLRKFTETGWQLSYYTTLFIYGTYILYDKSWTWDTLDCFRNFPYHPLEMSIWWYYMLSFGFYGSMALRHFVDVKRKDFWEMFIHHIITLLLLTFSWTCNFVRMGSLVLVVHDIADVFLLLTKLFVYLGYKQLSNAFVIVFLIVWTISRLIIYPCHIIYTVVIKTEKVFDNILRIPLYYICNALLMLLLVLHIIWTYYILLVVIRTLSSGDTNDSRSDTSDIESEDGDEQHLVNGKANGQDMVVNGPAGDKKTK